jgi:hypothetical protein
LADGQAAVGSGGMGSEAQGAQSWP